MVDSHVAPRSLWAGAIGMDSASRLALAADFRGLIRQHNTLLASGPPLFHWAGIIEAAAGYLLWESCGTNWNVIRNIGACGNNGGSANTLTLTAGANTLAMNGAWFGDPSRKEALLDWPLTERLDWKLDYSVAVGTDSFAWLVGPVPFGSLDETTLEGLGYLHDDRAVALYGPSRGTMQRMQDGLSQFRSRPLPVSNLGWVPDLLVGKSSKFVTPGQPFVSTGKALVLAVRGQSVSATAEVQLWVDGTKVASVAGLPFTFDSVMQRSTPSAVLTPGIHTFAIYVDSPAANTYLSSLSVYEVA